MERRLCDSTRREYRYTPTATFLTGMKDNRTSEKWLERMLQDFVTARGGVAIKMNDVTKNGLPDRLILWPGGVAEFVELKSTGKSLRPIQRAVRAELKGLGFEYTVIDSETALRQWQNLNRDRTRQK